MRNLSYPEVALSLIVISTASGLAYSAWFEPALAQIERDRQATHTILLELAASRPERAPPTHDPVRSPLASKPVPNVAAPELRSRNRRTPPHRPTPRPNELELDDSADPISGLDSKE